VRRLTGIAVLTDSGAGLVASFTDSAPIRILARPGPTVAAERSGVDEEERAIGERGVLDTAMHAPVQV
jgi:hypothetical protein